MGGNKKKKNSPAKAGARKKKATPSAMNFGGLAGLISPAIRKEAGKAFKEILPSLLAFPTSGASAMASPNLGIGGYNNSMALSAPAANGTYVKHTKARMRSSPSGMTVRHREYIQDIVFGTAGDYENVVTLPINPGNVEMFPWLASIATRFETYSFKSLRFIYEPQCGTENEGTVMMAVDFDVVDAPPVDKLQFMTYDGAVRSPPWFAAVYDCAKYNLHKFKQNYITSDFAAPTGTDPKTYFIGNLFVATQSQSDPFTAGELYVEYEIALSTPQLSDLQSAAGYVSQTARETTGLYNVPAYATGELDVITEFDTPNSLLDGSYIIAKPGAYLVYAEASAPNNVGSFAIGFFVTPPPPGITQASSLILTNENGTGFGFASTVFGVANLTDPVYFKIFADLSGATGAIVVTLYILPFDSVTTRALGPAFGPPLTATQTRMEKFLHKRAVSHKARTRNQIIMPTVKVEEVLPTGDRPLDKVKWATTAAKPTPSTGLLLRK